jgi:hypothetical protein
MGTLVATVHVHRGGVSTVFLAGSTPPKWAEKLITNPAVWADEVQETPAASTPKSPTAAEIEAAERDAAVKAAAEAAAKLAAETIPPKSGDGATVEAWTAYALSMGFAVDGTPTVEEIIESLTAENIPTETPAQ